MTSSQQDAINQVIETLTCPICYLAMAGTTREPMVLPCGHSFCKQCVSRIQACPLCNASFSKPTRNISLIQISDIYNSSGLIPAYLNPPPPAPITWIPKIEPVCTYAATAKVYIEQDWYQCRTCGIRENEGFCASCKDKCHKGHDVFFVRHSPCFFCDCGAEGRHCHCLPRNTNELVCTNCLLNSMPATQPMYQCIDCGIGGNSYICQNCAIRCHHEHKLIYYPQVKEATCECYKHGHCLTNPRPALCTFATNGKNFIKQRWYHCETCGLVGNLGCCELCAHTCHQGHRVTYSGVSSSCFCDCGAGERGLHCRNLQITDDHYMRTCTNHSQQNQQIMQREYSCQTCCIPNSICEACAINCHINHKIEFIGMRQFSCLCKSSTKCIACFSPPLHHYNACFNNMIKAEDIRPRYICSTCSNKILCEACALKYHQNHNVHLVDYSSFVCQNRA